MLTYLKVNYINNVNVRYGMNTINEYCTYGSVFGVCCDEYPPFKVAKAKHEVFFNNETYHVCDYCFVMNFENDDEREDYTMVSFDKKSYDKFVNNRERRAAKYNMKFKNEVQN